MPFDLSAGAFLMFLTPLSLLIVFKFIPTTGGAGMNKIIHTIKIRYLAVKNCIVFKIC
jgi:hypothetical protein